MALANRALARATLPSAPRIGPAGVLSAIRPHPAAGQGKQVPRGLVPFDSHGAWCRSTASSLGHRKYVMENSVPFSREPVNPDFCAGWRRSGRSQSAYHGCHSCHALFALRRRLPPQRRGAYPYLSIFKKGVVRVVRVATYLSYLPTQTPMFATHNAGGVATGGNDLKWVPRRTRII